MINRFARQTGLQTDGADKLRAPGRRLEPLDGMRGVAILLVVLFHYFQRFPDYYPYGDALFPLVKRGYLGVHLFFIISGFVIALTLERRPGIVHFAIGRFVRLWPAMLVCSALTFVIMQFGNSDFAEFRRTDWRGFLPSLTFTPPGLWQPIVGETSWIDGAYWSLFVEVRFYFWIALAYFLFGVERQLKVMSALMILTVPAAMLLDAAQPNSRLAPLIDILFFTEYLPLFCLGMTCYQIYRSKLRSFNFGAFALSLSLAMSQCKDLAEAIFVFIAAMWFLYFALRKSGFLIDIFATQALTFFGAISYSLYLLHQNIGVFLITLMPKGMSVPFYLLSVGLFFGLVTAMAYFVFRGVERPVQGIWRSIRQRTASPSQKPLVSSASATTPETERPS